VADPTGVQHSEKEHGKSMQEAEEEDRRQAEQSTSADVPVDRCGAGWAEKGIVQWSSASTQALRVSSRETASSAPRQYCASTLLNVRSFLSVSLTRRAFLHLGHTHGCVTKRFPSPVCSIATRDSKVSAVPPFLCLLGVGAHNCT